MIEATRTCCQRALQNDVPRGTTIEPFALQVIARLFRRIAAMDEDQPPIIKPQASGFCQRSEDDRGPLVHADIGNHQLSVGMRDHSVRGRDLHDLFRAERPVVPGIGIGRCHV